MRSKSVSLSKVENEAFYVLLLIWGKRSERAKACISFETDRFMGFETILFAIKL